MAEEKSGARSQSLLSGAFILVVATVLVKDIFTVIVKNGIELLGVFF